MTGKIQTIFCINTGRSGSEYLANLFNHVEGCRAYHEPDPIGNGYEMRQFMLGNDMPIRKLTEHKASIIQRETNKDNVYVETNHCFIKGFGWFIPEYFNEQHIGVIILTRKKADIVKSLMRLTRSLKAYASVSPLLPKGRKWYLVPDKKNPIVEPPSRLFSPYFTYQFFRILKIPYRFDFFNRFLNKYFPHNFISRYEEECFKWYIEETYELASAYKTKFPKIRFYQVDIGELNTASGVTQMLDFFGLKNKKSFESILGKKTNLKHENHKR